MGSYLSQPILSKSTVVGDDLDCPHTALSYACVDMQGWRKSMEDAHVIDTRVSINNNNSNNNSTHISTSDSPCYAKVFGVFDGHGGPEVARFCQQYMIEVLSKEEKWAQHGDVHGALIEAFHTLDLLIDDPERREELMLLRNNVTNGSAYSSTTSGNGVKEMTEVSLQEQQQEEKGLFTSEEESIISLEEDEVSSLDTAESSCEGILDDSEDEEEDQDKQLSAIAELVANNEDSTSPHQRKLTMGEAMKLFQKFLAINSQLHMHQENQNNVDTNKDSSTAAITQDALVAIPGDVALIQYSNTQSTTTTTSTTASTTSSSSITNENEATKKNNEQTTTTTVSDITYNKLGAISDGTIDNVSTSMVNTTSQTIESITNNGNMDNSGSLSSATVSPFQASCVINGRQVCTLSRHPVQAGCTSIVAVLIGRTLFVANAGDSRAVLCRGRNGVAVPLSEDHKPLHKTEMDRITKAGGFVNRFGRVNGNLNLSRSIGDLKYKQIPGLCRSEQMITAEPDVLEIALQENDEFIIIGCDGIWDCLSNEEAVRFVLKRIDQRAPQDVLIEMFDEIVSKDPSASMGIGGDNMTCILIDLLPNSRSYHQKQQQQEQEQEGD